MDQRLKHVAVIGGGCAGLAAATELASRGIAVTLFEAARHLGGRARGLNWKGRRLDNGQHILLGAYRETLRLMRLAGADPDQSLLRLPLQLEQHAQFSLRAAPSLPAPLHVMAGLLSARGLRKRERLTALMLMARLKLNGFRVAHDLPLAEYLQQQRQPDALIRWLWEPLCLAALNTPLARASTRVFLNVLRDSFAGSKSDSDLLLPRHDLSTLLIEPLAACLRRNGGEIRLGSKVESIRRSAESGYTLLCSDLTQSFSDVVVAVPPFHLNDLLADFPELHIETPEDQPIYTVYLQYADTARLPFPMIGLTGGHAQWVLDRGALDAQHGLMAAVISAEGPHQALTQEALAQEVSAELASAFPQLAAPLWHKVIAEKRATFACTPGLKRPPQQTPFPGLYIAGDFSEGDYPATIEGAVRSGVKCANLISGNKPT